MTTTKQPPPLAKITLQGPWYLIQQACAAMQAHGLNPKLMVDMTEPPTATMTVEAPDLSDWLDSITPLEHRPGEVDP